MTKANIKEVKEFDCDICNTSYICEFYLNRHLKSKTHQKNKDKSNRKNRIFSNKIFFFLNPIQIKNLRYYKRFEK